MYYKINGAWCFDLLLLMLTFALSANLADEDDCCRRLKIFLKWFALFEIWCACRNQR